MLSENLVESVLLTKPLCKEIALFYHICITSFLLSHILQEHICNPVKLKTVNLMAVEQIKFYLSYIVETKCVKYCICIHPIPY